MNKKGVSLVTVLLFMLVATIAGTATYKWLSSENRSSASRMQLSEAGLAAAAGVESARSWMMYHGNEVGAIVKQYFANGKKPVSLNKVLNDLNGEKQNFSVSVVGVDASTPTYKIKIVSTGTSRSGSTYSESAILKVSGLYRVMIPHYGVNVDFNYSYFGGSITYEGSTEMTSLVVNGNWDKNPPKTTTGDFVVTGNASLSGSGIDVAGTTCVGGNLNAENGITSKDMYVVGTTSGTALSLTTSGDAYFEGPVIQGQQPINIGGSMTAAGVVTTNAQSNTFTIAKNLCVETGGQIRQENFSRAFTVSGNVWMPGHNPVYTGSTDENNYDKIILGNTAESQVFIADAYPYNNYKTMQNSKTFQQNRNYRKLCGQDRLVSTKDTFEFTLTNCTTAGCTAIANGQRRIASADKDLCGSWRSVIRENWTYHENGTTISGYNNYSKFDENFTYWDGTPYQSYKSVAQKDNMYYFYYTGGIADVEFKEYNSPNFKHFVGNLAANANDNAIRLDWYEHGTNKNYPNRYQVSQKFSSPTSFGAYYVGEQLYNDQGQYHYLNYTDGKPTGSPYCYRYDDDRPQCAVSPWFTTKGVFSNTMPATKPFVCAEDAKTHCDEIWVKKPGCDGSHYKVDDMLQTGYSAFIGYANAPQCAKDIIALDHNARNNFNASKLNDCYKSVKQDQDAAKTQLYNGYLVMDFPDGTWFKSTQGSLEGKYIFIIRSGSGEALKLPSMTTSSYVMLYLPEGYNELQQTNSSGTNNYFIYSLGNISNVQSSNIQGTIYMSADKCSKVNSMKSSKLEYNKKLLEDMTANGLICPASAATCGGASTDGTPVSSASTVITEGYDADYIAVGAQLHVEIESEYRNQQRVDTDTATISPSVIVLPRIVYLNQDAVGKLSDYYSVVPLNGAEITGTGSVACSPAGAPPTSGPMVTDDNLLSEGFFTCSYTEGTYSSTFYVNVSGVTATSPRVKFDDPSSVDFNSGTAYDETVSLVIPGVTSTTSSEFTIDIAVINASLSGWTITPLDGVVEQTGSTSDKVYTYTGHTNSGSVTVPVFNVKTTTSAKSGSVIFILQTPINCTVSSPGSKSFNIYGSATIRRDEISKYCEINDCSGTIFDVVKNDENCETDAQWVAASGPDCKVSAAGMENKEWKCNAGNGITQAITLSPKAFSNEYCDIYIPTENNSITGALDDADNDAGGYTLYGSLKKKRFNLHVGFSNTDKGVIIVKTKANASSSWSELGRCSNHSDGCDYRIYANTSVELEVDPNGAKFNYWKCSGDKCKYLNLESATAGIVMDGDYRYTAHFNERDKHCFYTDFKGGESFCSGSNPEYEKCVDKCNSGTQCGVGAGIYGDSTRWLMVYANDKGSGWEAPITKDGYIYSANDKNSNNSSGNQSVILHSNTAGANGTLTARIQTTAERSQSNTYLNSGFILRSTSNGSEYIILNIFGEKDKGEKNHSTHARICYVQGQNTNQENTNCVDHTLLNSGNSLALQSQSILDVSVKISGSSIGVDVKCQEHCDSKLTYSTSFTLASPDWKFGTLSGNQFVGFKISDQEFKVGDIGWKADDFSNESCFDYPSVSCSMASNYLGGRVPVNTAASPWVGFSSWFADKDVSCTAVSYYYNGCDMSSSLFNNQWSNLSPGSACGSESDDGYYKYGHDDEEQYRNGMALSGTDNPYNFSFQGAHGVKHADGMGIVRNAFVMVTCDAREYADDCGEFYVGDLTACSRNEILAGGSSNVYVSTMQLPIVLDNVVNLRDSKLVFDVENFSDQDYIDVVLEDELEIQTPTRSITPTSLELNVNDMSNQFGFNPEKIKKIYLTGSNNFTVKSIISRCPNAVGISCRDVSFSGSAWVVNATYTPSSENAKKCMISTNSTEIPSSGIIECPENGVFNKADEGFYERLNKDSGQGSYEFTLSVFDHSDATETSEPSDTCKITPEKVYEKAAVTCSIDRYEVFQGGGVPKLTYSFANCPDYGCDYTVTLSDGSKKSEDPLTTPRDGLSEETWQPDVNKSNSKFDKNATYTYTVSAFNKETHTVYEGSPCTKTFTVREAIDATASCYVNSTEKKLYISVNGANYQQTSINVSYSTTDVLGNVITTYDVAVGTNDNKEISLAGSEYVAGQEYTFAISLGSGTITCDGSYTVPVPQSSSSSVVVSSSSVTSSSSATTLHCKFMNNRNDEVSTVYQSTNGLKFVSEEFNNSGSGMQVTVNGKWLVWENGIQVEKNSEQVYWNNGSSFQKDFQAAKTVGPHLFSLVKDGSTLCSRELTIIEAGSDVTTTCSIKNSSNENVTQVWVGAGNIKLETDDNNTSGEGYKIKLVGKKSENNVDVDMNIETTWNNGGKASSSQFSAPLTAGTYTYYYKTNTGEHTICSKDLLVVTKGTGATASCKFQYNSSDITEVAGGKTDIAFYVYNVAGVPENFKATLHYNGTTKTVECGNSSCWNNTFTAPDADTEDRTYTFSLKTTDGLYEICSADLMVKKRASGGGGSGGGSGGDEVSGGSVTLEHGGSYYEFEPGKIYQLNCGSNPRTLICSAQGGGKDLYMDGSNPPTTKVFSSFSWQGWDGYQAAGSCITGKYIKVVGGNMRCKNDY